MRLPVSLAVRLTLLFGIASAVVFPMFGWIIVETTEKHFIEEDSDELAVIAAAIQGALDDRSTVNEPDLRKQRFEDILVGHHDASLYIARPDGQVLYTSPSQDLSALAPQDGAADNHVRLWKDGDRSYHVLTQAVADAGFGNGGMYSVSIAVPIDHQLQFLASFRRDLSLMIAGCVVLMSLLGWISVRQGHAPLHNIVARIRRISADKWSARLSPEEVPAELTELAVSFNEMLERVDESFHRLSDFNADIAHELRTPITSLMTQTQVGLSRVRTTDEYREILYSNLEDSERMAQMVSDMLFLAQADQRSRLPDVTELELGAEMRALCEYYEGWADERGVTLSLHGTAEVAGDQLMLQRAFSNLLSNAIHHTPAGATVRIELSRSSGGNTHIVVENPGEAIPEEHLAKLFDRFYRIDPSRQQLKRSVGLGLAIVRSIINAHGGEIDVVSTNECTRFTIVLPARLTPAAEQ